MSGTLSATAAVAKPLSPLTTRRTKCRASVGALVVSNSRKSVCPYETLRIKPNASVVEIKTAYRRLAKRFHPDSDSSESEGKRFIEIHDAYITLSDAAARSVYDLSLRLQRTAVDLSVGARTGFRPTRRWETDQCW